MTIFFIGNFEVSYSSESHYLRTLRQMGHEVVTFQENHTSGTEILKAVENGKVPDWLFWVHTHSFKVEGMAEVLKQFKEQGIPTVGYHLDLYKGIGREPTPDNDYWKIEYFFTCDKNFVPDLQALGIKAYYLPAGVVADECYLGNKVPQYEHDVIFTGSKGYHREWPYRPQLINWLQDTYRERFAHYGGDGRGVVRGHALNDLYASSKIVVGDTLCIGFNYPYYFSDRLYEAVGRGGFLIFPYIKGIEECFDLETELVTYEFGNFEQLKQKIDYYLEHPEEREKIRQAGFERVKKDHTYTHRLNHIIATITQDRI